MGVVGRASEVRANVGTDQMVPGSVILFDGWQSKIGDAKDTHLRPQRRIEHTFSVGVVKIATSRITARLPYITNVYSKRNCARNGRRVEGNQVGRRIRGKLARSNVAIGLADPEP